MDERADAGGVDRENRSAPLCVRDLIVTGAEDRALAERPHRRCVLTAMTRSIRSRRRRGRHTNGTRTERSSAARVATLYVRPRARSASKNA